jgi:hypothetical protein
MSANFVLVDPELKRHCEAVKYQKASMKDLAEYYVSYMDRMGKEADPRVKAKLASKEYSDNIQPVSMGYGMLGGIPGSGNQFPGHQPGFGGMPGFPHPPGGPSFGAPAPGGPSFGAPSYGGPGGFNMGGGQRFSGAPGGGHTFGGAGGFNMGGGAGYGAPAPHQGNFGGQPAQPFGAQYGNNPFANVPTQAAQGGYAGFPMGAQGYQHPSPNPFTQQGAQMQAKPPITSVNMQQPQAYAPPSYSQPQQQAPGKQFDDIFADPMVPAQNPAFGGDKKPAAPDTTDDFLKQLEDLKKL